MKLKEKDFTSMCNELCWRCAHAGIDCPWIHEGRMPDGSIWCKTANRTMRMANARRLINCKNFVDEETLESQSPEEFTANNEFGLKIAVQNYMRCYAQAHEEHDCVKKCKEIVKSDKLSDAEKLLKIAPLLDGALKSFDHPEIPDPSQK